MLLARSLAIRWDEHNTVKGKRRKPTVQPNEANPSSGPQSIARVTPRLFSHVEMSRVSKAIHGITSLASILFGQVACGGFTLTLAPRAGARPR